MKKLLPIILLLLLFTSCPEPDIQFTEDVYESDNTLETATLLEKDDSQSHTLHIGGDVDWLKFEAEAETSYDIKVFSEIHTDISLYLYDTDRTTQLAYNENESNQTKISDWECTTGGTYYIKVIGNDSTESGFYEITLADSPVADVYEDDDTKEDAGIIDDDTLQSHTLHIGGDVDWLKFEAVAGKTYTIETFSAVYTDTKLYLYGTDGTSQLAYNDDKSNQSRISDWVCSTSETYYIKVTGNDATETGDYNITLRSVWGADTFEPDNAMGTATTIDEGSPQSHTPPYWW